MESQNGETRKVIPCHVRTSIEEQAILNAW
jgi:hypothetical protein